MTATPFTVFLCGTHDDLLEEREAVLEVLRAMQISGQSMEYFGAAPGQPIETCLAYVALSDIVVVIIGHLYGSPVPPHSLLQSFSRRLSFSETEYREARRRNKPCLIYMRHEAASVPAKFTEQDPERLKRLRAWKLHLQKSHTVASFDSAATLARQLQIDLTREAERRERQRASDHRHLSSPQHSDDTRLSSPSHYHVPETIASVLRRGIGVFGGLLPWVLWFGGSIMGIRRLESISAYYHTPLRDVFVGGLVAFGLMLFLYKGFSTPENWGLNLAGILAVLVALFPTSKPFEMRDVIGSLHVASLVAFFICIGYVTLFRASDTLSLLRDTAMASRYRTAYRLLGVVMIMTPLSAIMISLVLPYQGVFFVEALGLAAFAAYWLVKSQELRMTDAERLALAGVLRRVEGPGARHAGPGRVVVTSSPEAESHPRE